MWIRIQRFRSKGFDKPKLKSWKNFSLGRKFTNVKNQFINRVWIHNEVKAGLLYQYCIIIPLKGYCKNFLWPTPISVYLLPHPHHQNGKLDEDLWQCAHRTPTLLCALTRTLCTLKKPSSHLKVRSRKFLLCEISFIMGLRAPRRWGGTGPSCTRGTIVAPAKTTFWKYVTSTEI